MDDHPGWKFKAKYIGAGYGLVRIYGHHPSGQFFHIFASTRTPTKEELRQDANGIAQLVLAKFDMIRVTVWDLFEKGIPKYSDHDTS